MNLVKGRAESKNIAECNCDEMGMGDGVGGGIDARVSGVPILTPSGVAGDATSGSMSCPAIQ